MMKSWRRYLKSSFLNFKIFTDYIIVTDFGGFSTGGSHDDFIVTEEQFNKFWLKFSFAHILIFHSDFVQWYVEVWYVYWYVLALFRPMTNKGMCSSAVGWKILRVILLLEQVIVCVAEHNLNLIWTLWKYIKQRHCLKNHQL